MKNYLTIIRKSDFTDLFKFGYLFINVKSVVNFDGNIEKLRDNIIVRNNVFECTNQFDYSFTVLLVHFKNNHIEKDSKLYIEEVQSIFALDTEAKREIEISYDPRIIIGDPIWPDATNILQERFLYEDAKKGVENIWEILKIKQPISDFELILPDKDIKEIAYQVQNDKRPEGAQSFWVYLLRYQRHGFFPKDAIGFFMDIINVYINTQEKMELSAENIERTNIYRQLILLQDKNLEMNELVAELEGTKEGNKFFNKLNEMAKINTADNLFLAVHIALLFLRFKDIFNNGFNISEKNTLNRYSELFPEAYNFTLYLLGIYLGNSHTFECLYDTMPLPIFEPISQGDQIKQPELYTGEHQDDVIIKNKTDAPLEETPVETHSEKIFQDLHTNDVCNSSLPTAPADNTDELNHSEYLQIENLSSESYLHDIKYIFIIRYKSDKEYKLAAVAVMKNKRRKLIGVAKELKEKKENLYIFLKYLKLHGLSKVELIISDMIPGVTEYLKECFPAAKWQYCVTNFKENVLSTVVRGKEDVQHMLKDIYEQQSEEKAREKAEKVIERLKEMKLTKAEDTVKNNILCTLSYYKFDSNFWFSIRSIQPKNVSTWTKSEKKDEQYSLPK